MGGPGEHEEVEVVVEVPRGSRVKRAADGSVDFVSPWPSPFNYGSVPDHPSADGEPLDALILGQALPVGHRARWPVHGVVRFVDQDLPDDKLICSASPPTPAQEHRIRTFFRRYARIKRAWSRLRGQGTVAFRGIEPWP